MDIKIRGISESYINNIDDQAKQISERTGKKFSRNDYLLLVLERDKQLDLLTYQKTEFDLAVDQMIISNEKLTENICELTSVYERLFNFLISEGGI